MNEIDRLLNVARENGPEEIDGVGVSLLVYAVHDLRAEIEQLRASLAAAEAENARLRALIPQAYIRGVNDYAYGNIVLTDDLYHRAAAWLAEQETK